MDLYDHIGVVFPPRLVSTCQLTGNPAPQFVNAKGYHAAAMAINIQDEGIFGFPPLALLFGP